MRCIFGKRIEFNSFLMHPSILILHCQYLLIDIRCMIIDDVSKFEIQNQNLIFHSMYARHIQVLRKHNIFRTLLWYYLRQRWRNVKWQLVLNFQEQDLQSYHQCKWFVSRRCILNKSWKAKSRKWKWTVISIRYEAMYVCVRVCANSVNKACII